MILRGRSSEVLRLIVIRVRQKERHTMAEIFKTLMKGDGQPAAG